MPRFGIPFLVIATLAGCVAINTIQFPTVRNMFRPGEAGNSGSTASGTSGGNAGSDLDSSIPEPIAALDLSSESRGSSFPESSPSTEMIAESSAPANAATGDRYADQYSDLDDSSPVVAEVAQPIASEHAEFSDSYANESDFTEEEENSPPAQTYGAWDDPSFYRSGDEGAESRAEPYAPSDSSTYDSGGDSSYNRGGGSGYNAGSTIAEDRYGEDEGGESTYTPPPASPPANTEIEWPAEAATSARYARRSTTSVVAHGGPPQAVNSNSAPESNSSTAVAASRQLVPVRRPPASVELAQPVSVSEGRPVGSQETSASPKVERLPVVK